MLALFLFTIIIIIVFITEFSETTFLDRKFIFIFLWQFNGIEDANILILSLSTFFYNKILQKSGDKCFWHMGDGHLRNSWLNLHQTRSYMFFFIFDLFAVSVRPKMSLLSMLTLLHLQWGLWWSDSVLSSLIQRFIFFFLPPSRRV